MPPTPTATHYTGPLSPIGAAAATRISSIARLALTTPAIPNCSVQLCDRVCPLRFFTDLADQPVSRSDLLSPRSPRVTLVSTAPFSGLPSRLAKERRRQHTRNKQTLLAKSLDLLSGRHIAFGYSPFLYSSPQPFSLPSFQLLLGPVALHTNLLSTTPTFYDRLTNATSDVSCDSSSARCLLRNGIWRNSSPWRALSEREYSARNCCWSHFHQRTEPRPHPPTKITHPRRRERPPYSPTTTTPPATMAARHGHVHPGQPSR